MNKMQIRFKLFIALVLCSLQSTPMFITAAFQRQNESVELLSKLVLNRAVKTDVSPMRPNTYVSMKLIENSDTKATIECTIQEVVEENTKIIKTEKYIFPKNGKKNQWIEGTMTTDGYWLSLKY